MRPTNELEEMKLDLFEYIKKEYAPNITIDTCTNLMTRGIIDSFSSVNLILYIEKKYNVKLRNIEFTKQNFDSLDNLVSFLFKIL